MVWCEWWERALDRIAGETTREGLLVEAWECGIPSVVSLGRKEEEAGGERIWVVCWVGVDIHQTCVLLWLCQSGCLGGTFFQEG